MSRYSDALGRALGFCAARGVCSLEAFLQRASWELYHLISDEVASVAFVLARVEGGRVVCKPDQVATLPVEVLSGLSLDAEVEAGECRVRDHALDSVRFLDARFRSSIVGVVELPEAFRNEASSLVLWVGLHASASPKRMEMTRSMKDAVIAWLTLYGESLRAIKGWLDNFEKRGALIREMRAVAHDARAPLASIHYLLPEIAAGGGDHRDDVERLRSEVKYVRRLLEQLSPHAEQESRSNAVEESIDLLPVLRRVVARQVSEIRAKGGAVQWSVPYAETRVVISELDCERVFSNIICNAVRHSDTAKVRIEVELRAEGDVVTRVHDSGPGFPRSIIERLKAKDRDQSSLPEARGWGIGLLSCKSRIEAYGGKVSIHSELGGSRVEITLRGAARSKPILHLQVAEPECSERIARATPRQARVDVIVVDDDREHARSLERLLVKSGVVVSSHASVQEALHEIGTSQTCRVLCDAHMPDGGAESLLSAVRGFGQRVQVAVMSAESNENALYRYAVLGAKEYFFKPVNLDSVLEWIKGSGSNLKQVS